MKDNEPAMHQNYFLKVISRHLVLLVGAMETGSRVGSALALGFASSVCVHNFRHQHDQQ